jgi:hypothetical protein
VQAVENLVARALFLQAPGDMLTWDPEGEPLLLRPNCREDSSAATFLKAYALSADVHAFFRRIWRPIWPTLKVRALTSCERTSIHV